MNNSEDQPVTKRDLELAISELKNFVVDREASLFWKAITVQVTLIGAIAGGQWVAFVTLLEHWKR